jgi:hypothetical protein
LQIISPVPQTELIRYYVKSESGKDQKIWESNEEEVRHFDERIDSMPDDEARSNFQRLSEKRQNELRTRLDKYSWHLARFSPSELHLPQINPTVEPYLQDTDRNLLSFASKVKGAPSCSALGEFRDDGIRLCHERLIVMDESGRFRIMDGSHRAVVMCLRGREVIEGYLASL